ncbi:MAG TPA: carbon storage regulator [Tepidisphaeraceae bacterium]|jgi:carbon storage regulator|nr:carbon storage regulator [Tepidisphaeraceae bacterium]
MLVLSREPGTSIHIGSLDEACLVTVLGLLTERRAVAVLVNRATAARPGDLESRSVELAIDAVLKIGESVEVTLVELREDKARIGINAPKDTALHRLEVYEALSNGKRRGPDPEDGPAGSRVPRPSSPSPVA